MDVINLKFLKMSVWRSQAYLWAINCLSVCHVFLHSNITENLKRIKTEFLNAFHLGSPVCFLHFPLKIVRMCMCTCIRTYRLRLNHLKISCRYHDTLVQDSSKMWLLRMRAFLYITALPVSCLRNLPF